METSRENIALVDMDGTLVDYDKGMTEAMQPYLAENEKPYDLYSENKPEHIKRISKLVRTQPGFWLNLKTIQRGIEILILLHNNGFKLHILTKGPFSSTNAWTEKVEWCQKNLSAFGRVGKDFGMTITSDKGLVYGKILFDDYPVYCQRWLEWRPRGLVIQLKTEQNKDWVHPNVVKYDGTNSEEIYRRILEVKSR